MSLTLCSGGFRDAAQAVGDPVDVITGANFDHTLEFRLTGALELRWYRHYDSSQSHRRFALGWGQTHDLDRMLRLDSDGIRYIAPLGRVIGFPPLAHDGAQCVAQGYALRRLSIRKYWLQRHGEPTMEFEFQHPLEPARVARLFRGKDEIRLRYGASHRLEAIRDAAGRDIRVVEEDGRLVSLTRLGTADAPEQLLVAYHYDERGNLLRTQNSDGHGYQMAYDEANRLVHRTGRSGFKFRFAYDAQGRCIRAMGDQRLHGVALQYDAARQVTEVTRADLGVWRYFYDDSGLTQIVDPLGGARRFARDAMGRVVTQLDPNGNATQIEHDAAGAPQARIDALGHRTPLPEDPNAPEPGFHRVAANPAEYEFGRLVDVEAITLPEARHVGQLPLSSQAYPLVWARPVAQHKSLTTRAPLEVPPLGVLWWPAPAAGRVFNEFGKLIEQHDPWGRRRCWRYDPSGNLAEYIDFDGGRWTEAHGLWHYETALTNPLGAEVRFGHTCEGEVAFCVDAGGTHSEYRYDARDKLIEVRRHGVVRDSYVRDAAGNLVAKHGRDGRELLRFQIGPGNLMLQRSLASGDVHRFEYDAIGRCLTAVTTKDRIELGYDRLGNLACDQRNGAGAAHRYVNWRRPAESVLFGRFSTCYAWPDKTTLQITDPGGLSHVLRFHGDGLLERQFGHGSREAAQYDNMGRCLFKSLERRNGRVWNRRYHWSGESELRRVEDSCSGTTRHEYDAAHRLSRRFVEGRVEDFVLDPADNLLSQPGLQGVVLAEGNRLHSANGERFEYDDRNHIALRWTPAGTVRYGYDSRDQLVRVETPAGVWQAEYDALGRRSRKSFAGGTTEFFWSADQLVAEIDAAGRVRIYVHADPLALTPLMFIDYASIDAPPASGQRYFIFSDQVGAPCVIEDASGTEVWRAQIAPFGQAEIGPDTSISFNLRFPGHYADDEIGLYYNRFRHYDPQLGRYLQSDPWGISGGFNLYAYRLNPLGQADVRGLGEENKKKGKPCPDEEGTNKPGLTKEQEDAFRKLIDNPPAGKTPDDMRYQRYLAKCEAEGRTPLPRTALEGDPSWQKANDQLRKNQERGLESQDSARKGLSELLGVPLEDNNRGDTRSFTSPEDDGREVTTRPDSRGVDEDGRPIIHEHKDKSGEDQVVNNDEQMRAQQRAAGEDGRHVVTMSSDEPNIKGKPPTPRPSGPLGNNENTEIYYTDSNGQVTHKWVPNERQPGGGTWRKL